MAAPLRGEVTHLLARWSRGDEEALARLMPLVYTELRRLAAGHLRRERRGHTLATLDLVHEALLRLLTQNRVLWQGHRHFFATASHMMRRVLVDHARRRPHARGGDRIRRLSLDEVPYLAGDRAPELVALDEALTRLGAVYPHQARVVELRVFGGLTVEETARLLGVSSPTVGRRWRMARAWLYRHLSRGGEDGR